jgi:hypothetical protein
MATATIQYDLSNPDDTMDFKRACKANDMSCVLFQLIHNAKKEIEYKMEGKNMDQYETLDFVFDEITEIINEHNIDIDDIIS